MSQVTNVILTVSAGEETAAEMLNGAWDLDGCCEFAEAEYSAGCKNLECGVFLEAFNHLDLAAFIKAIEAIPWHYPEYVQMFVKEEHEDRFHEIGLWERK